MESPNQPELPLTILTERLHLRPVEMGDIDCLWGMDSDPEVMRYIESAWTDREAHRERYEKVVAENKMSSLRIITVRGQPDALGWVFMRETADGKWMELGYRLLREFWGQGLVPESCRGMLKVAFEEWNLPQVMALIMHENRNSRRVLEKLHFRFDHVTTEYYDTELDLYVLDRETWNTPHGGNAG